MTKKELMEGLLSHCPDEFDLNHYQLGSLFCYAGIGVDNCIIGRGYNDSSNPDYRAVIRVGKILYKYAEDAKARTKGHPERIDPITDIFLLKILRELGQEPKTLEEIANPVIQIGLDFIKIRELPKERQKELRDLCLLFSKRASSCWHELNPYGFKHYAA